MHTRRNKVDIRALVIVRMNIFVDGAHPDLVVKKEFHTGIALVQLSDLPGCRQKLKDLEQIHQLLKMWLGLHAPKFFSNDGFDFPPEGKAQAGPFKKAVDLREFRRFMEGIAQEVLFQLNDDLSILRFYTVVKIQVWNVWTNQNQVALHKARNVLTNMANPCHRFYIHQFVLGMIVPIKIISQAGSKEPERLARVGEHDFLLNFHLLRFICKVKES